MNSERRLQLRTALLLALDSSKPYSVTTDAIRVGLVAHGFRDLDAETLKAELDYLAEKNLIAEDGAPLAPEIRKWKITADGRDFLAKEGLA